MPTFRITAPDGTKLKITGAEMPSEAELDNIFRSVGKPVSDTPPPPTPKEGLGSPGDMLSGAWDVLNPVNMVKGATQMALHPVKTLLDPQLAEGFRAYDALKAGNLPEASMRAGSALIPVMGPQAQAIGDEMRQPGGFYRGLGKGLAVTALTAAPELGAKAKGAVPVLKDVAKGIGNSASDMGTYVSVGSGAGTGAAIGGHVGATVGAAISGAIKVGSDVWKAVAKGLAERKNISGAKAESMMLKMAPEELSAIADEVVKTPAQVSERAAYKAKVQQGIEEKRKAYWDAHPEPKAEASRVQAQKIGPEKPLPRSDNPDLQALTAEDLANAPGDTFKHGPEDAVMTLPQPKPKSGHVHSHGRKPAPVVQAPVEAPPAPEPAPVQAKTAPVKASPGQNARDWLQKYSAADAEGRRALVKGLGGKLNYEDMRQLAAYTDDLTGEASKAPALAEDHFRPVKLDHLKDSAPVVDIPAIAKKLESTPSFDPIMTPEGKGPAQIMGKIQDHPAYKELVAKIKGKSAEEAVQILADAELKDWLIKPTMELAGLDAPTPKMVRAAVERVKDSKYDAWQASERAAAEGDVVTRPHPGQASPAFVNDRLKYLQEQAAKRGDAPAKFAEQVAQNKTKGAELAAVLEQPEPRYISESQYRDSLRKTYHAKEGLQSSREVPQTAEIPAVGTRLLDDSAGPDGREFSELVEIPVSKVTISEDTGASKFRDVRRYAEWTLEGKEAPPIRVVQTDKGTLKTLDHRRLLAAKAAGKDTIKAWVNRATTSDRNGLVTGMTKELEAKGAKPLPIVDPLEGMTIYADDAKRLQELRSDLAPKPTARQQGEALHAKAKARGKGKESSGTVGFPPIVKAMSDAVESSLQAGRNKISNVKVKLSPDGSHEVFTFDLDGVPHSAPLKGKTAQALYRQGYLPGNVELDTKIANGLVLDKVAKSVRSKE